MEKHKFTPCTATHCTRPSPHCEHTFCAQPPEAEVHQLTPSVESGAVCTLCGHDDGTFTTGICKHVNGPNELDCLCKCVFPSATETGGESGVAAELLPCPFCGGAADVFPEEGEAYYAMCTYPAFPRTEACFAAIGENYDRDALPEHSFRTKEEAIAAWNTRAPSSLQTEVEALRNALVEARVWLDDSNGNVELIAAIKQVDAALALQEAKQKAEAADSARVREMKTTPQQT